MTHSEAQARAQLESILEMVKALEVTTGTGNDDEAREKAEQTIREDALEVSFRSGWAHSRDEMKPKEFNILLCTGGPACRIIGQLDEHGYPETATIEHRDWGTPWTEYRITAEQEEKVLIYCQQFYFGE